MICAREGCENAFERRGVKKFCSPYCRQTDWDIKHRADRTEKFFNKFKRKYKKYKKDYCEECGFIPVNMCQLDVDHIDGDKTNNTPENLQTLCANCHRLKTYINKDYKKKNNR